MKYFSQLGQDYWLLNHAFPGRRNGYFVDVGAFQMANGYMSNTLALEQSRGWTGLLIEANPRLCGPLKQRRARTVIAVVSDRRESLRFEFGDRGCNSKVVESGGSEVISETLTEILEREGAPTEIELLSLDIEGHETAALRGLDFDRYRFDCIIVEENGRGPEIRTLLESRGYRFLGGHGVDLYFVSSGLDPEKPSEVLVGWEPGIDRAGPVPTPLLPIDAPPA
jgi:FkbM family methyltransferase